ncbi:hypothetical protein BDF22DRAFT_744037 [Syncephalis plumigaleata]|nr:hypothetical protein BDF22DRAFT_744037 [Syncephalis plumigaleata]
MKASLIATTLLAFAAANAAAQSQQPVSETIVQNAYMIELHQEPGTAGVTIEQDQLRKAIKLMNIPFRERGTLTEAMNSLSIEVDDNDISRISELEQVKRVWPLHTVSQPRVAVTDTPQNATFPYYHAMTGVELLHNKS